jgi:hypothetical protein
MTRSSSCGVAAELRRDPARKAIKWEPTGIAPIQAGSPEEAQRPTATDRPTNDGVRGVEGIDGS